MMMEVVRRASEAREPLQKKLTKKEERLKLAYLITAQLRPACVRLARQLVEADHKYHGDTWPLPNEIAKMLNL